MRSSFTFIFVTYLQKYYAKNIEKQLIFHEKWKNFNNWRHEVTFEVFNGEFEYYRNNPKNSFIEDGVLTIKPSVTSDEYGEEILYGWGENGENGIDLGEDCTGERNSEENNPCHRRGYYDYIIPPIQSAKLISKDKFSFKYGVLEFEAKSPQGDWLWPAFSVLVEYLLL